MTQSLGCIISFRAKAVAYKLVIEYGVDEEQLIAVDIGPSSPLLSNSNEEGRAKSRRG